RLAALRPDGLAVPAGTGWRPANLPAHLALADRRNARRSLWAKDAAHHGPERERSGESDPRGPHSSWRRATLAYLRHRANRGHGGGLSEPGAPSDGAGGGGPL